VETNIGSIGFFIKMTFTLDYNEYFTNKPKTVELKVEKSISEIYSDGFTQIAIEYGKMYSNNGKGFVTLFLNSKSVQLNCASAVREFEKNIPYEPDEKISDYVGKLNLDEKKTRLLARTLKMIKLITSWHQEKFS